MKDDYKFYPLVDTKEYFDFMTELSEKAERLFPVQISGFTHYQMSFYFVYDDGNLYGEQNSIPVRILEKLIELVERE